MDERIERLEVQVAELSRTVARLEEELRAQPWLGARAAPDAGRAPTAALAEASAEPQPAGSGEAALSAPLPSGVTPARVLSLLGRSFLALGVAFLARALTDAGTLPPAAGLALAFGFALALCALAGRALLRGDHLSAGFHATTGSLIAYPLVWESSARLHLLTAPAAVALLAVYSSATLAVSWRRSSHGLAWLAAGAELTCGLVLLGTTDAPGAVTAALIALLAAALALSLARGWHGPRWPVALVSIVLVLRLGSTLESGAAIDIGRGPGVLIALALCLSLSLALAALRFARQRPGPFDWSLAPLGIVVGLLAARECAGPAGAVPLGALALALALASYAAAFAGGAARRAGPVAAHFYALLGMLLALTGSALLDLGAAGGTAWSLLGLAALLLAPRASSSALAIQGALWLWVGAAQAGLFAFAASAFAGGGSSPFAHLSFPCLIALTSALGAAAVLLLRRGETGVDHGVRAATLALLALSVDALAAALGTWALHAGDAGALAAMRTGVLAASALALATSSRALGARELRWLSLATLALGGVKLALDDLPHGRASTYVIGFALYGLALILVPRLTRASPAQE